MSRSSIAAGVDPGADLLFGTADDRSGSASTSGVGIGSIIIRGSLTGSANPSERFGIVAHKAIGPVLAGGKRLSLPWAFGNVSIVEKLL
jgi:hypothetical protein